MSVPFLESRILETPAGGNDPALCALQLLYEIDTDAARAVISRASSHPSEVIAHRARAMLLRGEDCLWGFRQTRSSNEEKSKD